MLSVKIVSKLGEGGQNQGVEQLLPGKGPEWTGIHHHEQNTGPLQGSWGFLSFSFFGQGFFIDD
jgi:hypothetical protein